MALPGPANITTIASGPFEASILSISSSPYSLAVAMLALNTCGRFLAFEFSKEQEKFLNQPMIRRFLIYVIFFMATRNLIMSFWLGTIVIVSLAYLLNENSSLYIFGRHSGSVNKTVGDTLALTPEEQSILKNLQDKSDRIKKQSEKPIELGVAQPVATHKQYEKVLQSLFVSST